MNKTLLTLIISMSSFALHAGEVRIYAAASLTNAITDIAKLYEQQTPDSKVITVFGASSALAKQIDNGAQADLFFSADQDWMNYLVQQKKVTSTQVKNVLNNELVVISPKTINVAFKPYAKFNFAQSFTGHLCTGEMETVPVGKYAKQSLTALNWLPDLKGRVVGTDNVRSALAFVERGECQVGIVYKTDALISDKVKIIGTFPAKTHEAIIYPAALTQQAATNKEALNFEKFMLGNKQAKAIFGQYGFTVMR